jgi:LCP family protein required for cell wall assembly
VSHDPRAPRPDDRAPRGDAPPQYTVYRAGRSPGLRGRSLRDLVRRRRGPGGPGPGEPRSRRRVTAGRVVGWVLLAALAWVLLSVAVFMVSAQLQEGVSERTEAALDGGGVLGGSTILVLGSDQRPKGSKEPGASTTNGRADSILLLRVELGQVRRLSILRDTLAEIPGAGAQKINASYALGGAALTIETVENLLGNGLRIDHVIEVSFEDFPDFIDSLGGITVEIDRCISSDPFGGRRFRLRRGEHHLDGDRALAFARVRKNRCAPNEDDRARARRQQQVLSAIRARLLSPVTFARLPWVAWQAPRTIRTDLKGPGLAALFADLMTGGSGQTRVLMPSGFGPGGTLVVPEEERARAVRALLR